MTRKLSSNQAHQLQTASSEQIKPYIVMKWKLHPTDNTISYFWGDGGIERPFKFEPADEDQDVNWLSDAEPLFTISIIMHIVGAVYKICEDPTIVIPSTNFEQSMLRTLAFCVAAWLSFAEFYEARARWERLKQSKGTSAD